MWPVFCEDVDESEAMQDLRPDLLQKFRFED